MGGLLFGLLFTHVPSYDGLKQRYAEGLCIVSFQSTFPTYNVISFIKLIVISLGERCC